MALPEPPAPASPSDAWCSNPIGLEDPDLLLLPRALLEAGANGFSSVDPAGPSSFLGEAPRDSAPEPFLTPDTGRGRAAVRDSSRPANKCPHRDYRRTD